MQASGLQVAGRHLAKCDKEHAEEQRRLQNLYAMQDVSLYSRGKRQLSSYDVEQGT
jgi:hypothetical protein